MGRMGVILRRVRLAGASGPVEEVFQPVAHVLGLEGVGDAGQSANLNDDRRQLVGEHHDARMVDTGAIPPRAEPGVVPNVRGVDDAALLLGESELVFIA